MSKSILCIILIFCAIIGCNSKTQNSKLNIQLVDSVKIPISQDFNPDRTRTQYIDSDSGEYLAILNKTKFSIGVFNLQEKKLKYTIPLTKEGPNGIGVDNGFHILSKDCLFIATIPPNIRILNFQGELKKSIPIENKSNSVNFLSSNNEIPFLFDKNKLFGIQPFLENFFEISKSKAQSTELIYSLDLSKKDVPVEWLPVFRPNGFWDEGKKDENLSWTERYDSIIIAPYTDHRIWIVSKKNKSLVSLVNAKSNSVNEFQMLSLSSIGGDEGIVNALQSDRYEIILYDTFRDIFYRFFFPNVDLDKFQMTPRQLFSNRPIVGVLVLDKNLNTIGEHIFETNYVQTWNYFVGKKGLYISTNNPNRDDFDENFLRYDIIRFEGLEYED